MSTEEEKAERRAELQDIVNRMRAEPKIPPEQLLPPEERHFLLMFKKLNEHNRLELMQFIAQLAHKQAREGLA